MSSHGTKPLAEFTIYIGPVGTDGPTLQLVPDGHGGWKVIKTPPWNPEALAEFNAAAKVLSHGLTMKNPELSRTVVNAAANFMHSEFGKAAGLSGGAVVIVNA